MSEYEVNCVIKPHRDSRHEQITHIGNTDGKWLLHRESAIARIAGKVDTFYTLDKATGKKAFIDVVREAGKQPYLRTRADGEWTDNLLAQGQCGPECRIV